MSEKKQQQKDYGQSMWDEYLEELEEVGATSEAVQGDPDKIEISESVQQDLLEYKDSNKGIQRNRNRTSSNRTSSNPLVKYFLFLMVAIMGIAIVIMTYLAVDISQNNEVIEEYIDSAVEVVDEVGLPLGEPVFAVNEQGYRLPTLVGDLLEDHDLTYSSEAFASEITEVGEEPVHIVLKDEYGNKIADLMVVSPTGEVVPIEEAIATGISVDTYEYKTAVSVGDQIDIYSGTYTLEEALKESGEQYTVSHQGDIGLYTIEKDVEMEYGYSHYTLQIETNGYNVSSITMIAE